MPDESAYKPRTIRVPVDAVAVRPPARGFPWTITAGRSGQWSNDARSEKAAADQLADALAAFLSDYRAPVVISFRGYVAVVALDMSSDGQPMWRQEIVRPDARSSTSIGKSNDWAEAEAKARRELAHLSTDWHDDTSVHEAAVFLADCPRAGDNDSELEELYRYAAWQRAAKAAIDTGRPDWHEWASDNAARYAIAHLPGGGQPVAAQTISNYELLAATTRPGATQRDAPQDQPHPSDVDDVAAPLTATSVSAADADAAGL